MEKINNKINIIIADDHKLFRNGLKEILSDLNNLIIIDEAENGSELIKKYFVYYPDIMIVDIAMPVLSGIDAVKQIVKEDSSARALFLSMYESEEYVYGCIEAGGMGLINKNIEIVDLINSINKVYSGNKYFFNYSEEQLNEIIQKFNNPVKPVSIENEEITQREKNILKYISEGLTSTEMAEKLNLSRRTIDTHRSNLIQKLNLKSLPELIKFAIEYYSK